MTAKRNRSLHPEVKGGLGTYSVTENNKMEVSLEVADTIHEAKTLLPLGSFHTHPFGTGGEASGADRWSWNFLQQHRLPRWYSEKQMFNFVNIIVTRDAYLVYQWERRGFYGRPTRHWR